MHVAGQIYGMDGSLNYHGSRGDYRSMSQKIYTWQGFGFYFEGPDVFETFGLMGTQKSWGFPLRCIRE